MRNVLFLNVKEYLESIGGSERNDDKKGRNYNQERFTVWRVFLVDILGWGKAEALIAFHNHKTLTKDVLLLC